MKFRSAFTLFELILAITLSATLLALIGTAINLYLLRVDAGRTRVEEAQLARSILATIAADVRAATTYQTQDISAIAQLAAAAAPFDVEEFEQPGTFSGSALGPPSGAGTAATAGSPSGSTSFDGSSLGGEESTSGLAPGLNGTLQELILDVARLPRLDELFPAVPQQPAGTTIAGAINVPRPSDAKTIRYFIRQGSALDPSDVAATSLAPDAQRRVGGLVRQTIDRAIRQMAEQTGNSQLRESGQVLVAPEVVQIQFRYFDGTAAVEEWNMQEQGAMPPAIEVRIWLAADGAAPGQPATATGSGMMLSDEHMYSQTIDLPLAQSGGASVSTTGMTEDATGGGGDDSSDDDGANSGGGIQ